MFNQPFLIKQPADTLLATLNIGGATFKVYKIGDLEDPTPMYRVLETNTGIDLNEGMPLDVLPTAATITAAIRAGATYGYSNSKTLKARANV